MWLHLLVHSILCELEIKNYTIGFTTLYWAVAFFRQKIKWVQFVCSTWCVKSGKYKPWAARLYSDSIWWSTSHGMSSSWGNCSRTITTSFWPTVHKPRVVKHQHRWFTQHSTAHYTPLQVTHSTLLLTSCMPQLQPFLVLCLQLARSLIYGQPFRHTSSPRPTPILSTACTNFGARLGAFFYWTGRFENNVPFKNTAQIYLINLHWKIGLGFKLRLRVALF